MRFAIIIPAYNEEKHIREVVRQSVKFGKTIVVDDGSTDATASEASKGGSIVLKNSTNRGKWSALKIGFNYAFDNLNAEAIIQLDGDGQHDPSDIPKFIQALESGAMIVAGQRKFDPSRMPIVRIISNSISSFVIMVLFWVWVPDTQCGYRAYSKKALKTIMSSFKSKGYEGETEIIILARINRLKIKKVGIQTVYNEEESNVSPLRDIRRFTFTTAKMRISYIRRQMTIRYLRYKFSILKKHFLSRR
ncbi:MAG: glycosyltransferase family 2 protein [Candidatus Bathyarchaeota archaeon]|nr:glycosyltransferase family 2 protein [Candidatus Bathyarchaeota archaeon]